MQTFEGIAGAADAIRRFYFRNEDDLPQHFRDRVGPHVGQGSSPVDLGAHFTRAVYANRDALPAKQKKEALELAAGTADIFDRDGFHSKLDGKAAGMSLALRRDSGEKAAGSQSWPKKDDDPAPDSDYAPPATAAGSDSVQ